MITRLSIALCIVVALRPTTAMPASEMLAPSADKPEEEWCYLAKSTTIIGVPFQPDVTQITFDGAVFTGSAELCFFFGEDDRRLLARGKTFLDGWLPVVQYAWRDGDIACEIEYFAAPLDGESVDNTVNFVQVRMRNVGAGPGAAKLTAGLRHNGGDYRFGGVPFSRDWQYAMFDSAVIRDGKLAYAFSPAPASREAVLGTSYNVPFAGATHGVTARTECCLVRYRRDLGPGESFIATFKMPRVPVADAAFNDKLARAEYAPYRTQIIAWWTSLLRDSPAIELPEKRFQDAYRASLVHILLGTRSRGGRKLQTDGLPYPDFFLTSVPELTMLYLTAGLNQFPIDFLVPQSIAQQQPSGLYFDRAVAHGVVIPATQGHILYSLAQTALFTRDKGFAEKIYPSLRKGVAFIEQSTAANRYGLLPPCYPYDAEMIDGHYTGQNLFALMGLRHVVRVARLLGKADDVAAWTKLAERYETAILKGIDASAKADGYIPPGLYSYLTGMNASRKFAEYQTHCDWENMILAWPTEVLAPSDPHVKGTLSRVRKGYAEGIMTYRHGMHLHQYITSNMIEQYLAMGDQYTALKDFYHQLLHSGSTHESFENLVVPWAARMVDPGCPPPHVWGTCKQGLMVRNFLLMEYGGRCGMEPGRRELWLFHCLSPAWVQPDRRVAIRSAPTEFGKVTASFEFVPHGAELQVSAVFHEPPAALRMRIPYFKELVSFRTDAGESRRDGNCILISPDAKWLSIVWRDRPNAHMGTFEDLLTEYRTANSFEGVRDGQAVIRTHEAFLLEGEQRTTPQPLSFDLVRQAFLHEYGRRAAECNKAGGKLIPVTAPAISGPGVGVIAANGWKVSATDSLSGHGPELIADGVIELASSWQSASTPQTLTIDLRKPTRLKGVHVWPYWGMNRHYRYTVEASADGQKWALIGDRRDNENPATPTGERFDFASADIRFIRITMLHHSLNPGVHVVEVKAIE